MRLAIFLRILFILSLSFFACSFQANAEDYYIACYYNDTNENRDSKNPELMWPSKVYLGASQNYYWALDSNSFFSGYTKLSGRIVDGFFIEDKLTYDDVLARCKTAIERGTLLWPSRSTYKLYEFKASTSNFTGYEYPIQFARDKSNQYKINKVVVFGDSISDAGNVKRWTKVWPYYPYWYGRYADGFNWTDYFSSITRLPILNFAYGGAKTEGTNDAYFGEFKNGLSIAAQNMISGNTKDYINMYLGKYLTTDSYKTSSSSVSNPESTLFVIWIGGNDLSEGLITPGLTQRYFDEPDAPGGINYAANRAVRNITEQISILNAKGAYHFLVINLPDIGKIPLPTQVSYKKYENDDDNVAYISSTISQVIDKYNVDLSKSVKNLQSSLGNKIDIVYLDISMLMMFHIANINPIDYSEFDFGYAYLDTKYQIPGGTGQYIQDFCYKNNYYNAASLPTSQRVYDFSNENMCKDSHGKQQKYSIFFDKLHPTSYTHCWISYDIESILIQKGFISESMKDLNSYKNYCHSKIDVKNLME